MSEYRGTAQKVLYLGRPGDGQSLTSALRPHLRFLVEGEVGAAHARADGKYLLGVFNNLGITKTEGKETADPSGVRAATILGPITGAQAIVGARYVTRITDTRLEILLPAGELAVLTFEP